MRKIIAFDLETRRLADEVGGWGNIRKMGLALAVIYYPAEGVYRDYTEREVAQLISDLRAADLIVGYNLYRFDYEVLRAYTDDPLTDLPTVDLLLCLYKNLGWRPRLDDVAAATLGERKSADGVQAVHWFRQGHLDKVRDYCRRDVEVTWRIYQFGRENGYVRCLDRSWRVFNVPVRW